MTHFTEEQLTLAYYNELDPELAKHLDQCSECRSSFERLKDLLEAIREYPVPERSPSYGPDVWARLLPRLPVAKHRPVRFRWWTAVPAFATLLVAAFLGGMLVQHRWEAPGTSLAGRQRVLLMVIGDHLDRSQILLSEMVNSSRRDFSLLDERDRARDLLSENRLLRQTAAVGGDMSHAALLDELERVLIDVANTPLNASPADLEVLQRHIASDGLLFKVRIVDANIRAKGQKI